MRKTKIVCTIGPACDSPEMIEKLCLAGMNVARLNFSHGTHEEHDARIKTIKEVSSKLNVPIAILLDTKGPEFRIKTFENGKIQLNIGDMFTFTSEDIVGDQTRVAVNFEGLEKAVTPGDHILVCNGLLDLVVREINGKEVKCEALTEGVMSDRKSMNFPGKIISNDYLSAQDKSDILFGIEREVDFIACSFVSRKEDLEEVHAFLEENGSPDVELIAKIENQPGIDNIEEICQLCSGIMIGRGDMGVEIAPEKLPAVQKHLITKCRLLGKRVITATEMLESMISSPRPTRAEVSDVANAVYDGTSAVMLSGETAAGKFPEQAVNWDWISSNIKEESKKNPDRQLKVLNLFAYTGGATLAAAKAGAAVTHVDASKGMVMWAKENAVESGLADAPIRWLVDDCQKFVEREIRRGNKYDGIIMDPPSYGRGPKGEIWKIEDNVYPFIELASQLLNKDSAFFLINSYTTGLQPAVLTYMLSKVLIPKFGGKVEANEIGLPVTETGLVLPCGASGRWSK